MEEKRRKLIDNLIDYLKNNDSAKEINKKLYEYYKYCNSHNLETYDNTLFNLLELHFIIESKPNIKSINEDDVKNAIRNLQEKKYLTMEEAHIVLDYVIEKTRNEIGKAYDIEASSLNGACGYSQVLTLMPFIELNMPCTINNANNFPKSRYRHAFGTVTLPIKENEEVKQKTFLLDATYRQFFSLNFATESAFYKDNESGPMAGYYITKLNGGLEVANKILKDGYIELDDNVLWLYGVAFSCESLNLRNIDELKNIVNIPIEEYKKALQINEELELVDEEEKEEIKDIMAFPKVSIDKAL